MGRFYVSCPCTNHQLPTDVKSSHIDTISRCVSLLHVASYHKGLYSSGRTDLYGKCMKNRESLMGRF